MIIMFNNWNKNIIILYKNKLQSFCLMKRLEKFLINYLIIYIIKLSKDSLKFIKNKK